MAKQRKLPRPPNPPPPHRQGPPPTFAKIDLPISDYAREWDEPGSAGGWTRLVDFTFRTYAIAVGGADNGHSYGYIRWGGTIDYDHNWASIWIDGVGGENGDLTKSQRVNWIRGRGIGPLTVAPYEGSLAGQSLAWANF